MGFRHEGELRPAEKAEVEAHLAACPECAKLAALMREEMAAAAAFPEVEPSAELMARLYAVPEAKREKKRFLQPLFDWLSRPALQPAYAAATGFLIVLCFVLFHPEGRGIRKAINVQLHRGIGTVEKLYADAGQPLTEEKLAALTKGSSSPIVIDKHSARFLLYLFWAFGLTNQAASYPYDPP